MQTIEYKSGRGKQLRLYELEAVPEGVGDVKAVETDDGIIFVNRYVVLFEAATQRTHVEDANSRMGLGGGLEVFLDANVDLMHATLQPNPAAWLQCCGFCELGHSKD